MDKEIIKICSDFVYDWDCLYPTAQLEDMLERIGGYIKIHTQIECIAFAKFTDDNGYTRTLSQPEYKWESLNDLGGKTDEELYLLFQKQNNKTK